MVAAVARWSSRKAVFLVQLVFVRVRLHVSLVVELVWKIKKRRLYLIFFFLHRR